MIPAGLYTAARFAIILGTVISLFAALPLSKSRGSHALQKEEHQPQQKPNDATQFGVNAYVGSKVCVQCHAPIASKYSRTDMGRSMSEITASLLENIPNSA